MKKEHDSENLVKHGGNERKAKDFAAKRAPGSLVYTRWKTRGLDKISLDRCLTFTARATAV